MWASVNTCALLVGSTAFAGWTLSRFFVRPRKGWFHRFGGVGILALFFSIVSPEVVIGPGPDRVFGTSDDDSFSAAIHSASNSFRHYIRAYESCAAPIASGPVDQCTCRRLHPGACTSAKRRSNMATPGKPLPQTPPSLRDVATGEHDDGLSAFAAVRPRLFGIAYRMLGSAAEAEDIVQDVWLRWQQSVIRSAVENPPAYLAMTTTRLCINVAQSAHSRHESYSGIWLPEPVDTSADPAIGAERGEALKLAVLLLLEKLSPTERAAYVLREAFDYPYD